MQSLGDETSRGKDFKLLLMPFPVFQARKEERTFVLGIPTAAVPVCPKSSCPSLLPKILSPWAFLGKGGDENRRSILTPSFFFARWPQLHQHFPPLRMSFVNYSSALLYLASPFFHTGQSNTSSLISMCAHNVLHKTSVSCLRAQLLDSETGRV